MDAEQSESKTKSSLSLTHAGGSVSGGSVPRLSDAELPSCVRDAMRSAGASGSGSGAGAVNGARLHRLADIASAVLTGHLPRGVTLLYYGKPVRKARELQCLFSVFKKFGIAFPVVMSVARELVLGNGV